MPLAVSISALRAFHFSASLRLRLCVQVFYAFAMVREYDPDTASLHWRVLEMSVVGSQLYL